MILTSVKYVPHDNIAQDFGKQLVSFIVDKQLKSIV